MRLMGAWTQEDRAKTVQDGRCSLTTTAWLAGAREAFSRVYEPGRGNTWLALAAWLYAVCQQRTRPKTLIEIGNDARHVVCEGNRRRAELPDRGLHEAG